eukprot:4360512-Pyramimonas_sp.AAC.1
MVRDRPPPTAPRGRNRGRGTSQDAPCATSCPRSGAGPGAAATLSLKTLTRAFLDDCHGSHSS